jgi:hypothetical protein
MPPNDGYQGTYWQAIQLPLAGGLRNRVDPRVRPSPFMDVCQDAQFDISGGMQTRYPYGPENGAIVGGGTLSNVRKIVPYGDELVLFTDVGVYSWNDKLSAWSPRGTHLAVAIDERSVCATNGDQIDGDRAELGNTVVIAWTEGAKVYAAALDKVTGSVTVAPTALPNAVSRPRVVALASRILVFADAGAGVLGVRAIDPAAPAAGIASIATLVTSVFNAYYDVVRAGSQDLCVGACRNTTTTSHTVFAVTSALAVTTTVKARTADGPVAVSTIPDGSKLQIVRASSTNIQGDLLTTATFADVFTAQAIGTANATPVNQIAAAHRSVINGSGYRCYVFWSAAEDPNFGVLFQTKTNWADTANTIGAQSVIVNGLGVGSRAFDDNGSVFVWMTFGQLSVFAGDVALASVSQAQNAYMLYRDDGFIAAKAAYDIGGGLRPNIGLLPGVALTGPRTYSWIGTARRRIVLNNGSSMFTARTPHDITFVFDSNTARRCARLGRTLYIAAGEILQYDGVRITEVGFHFYPWSFDVLKAGTGNVANGTYAYKVTWRWTNAKGEAERSTTATIGTATMSAGPAGFTTGQLAPLNATHKTMTDGAIAAEIWRTEVNGDADEPFFLATNPNPTSLTNPNKYIANNAAGSFEPSPAWRDEMPDTTLRLQEANPENGLVLEDLVPPAATLITSTDTRVFLAGIAGDPDRVWYSKLRVDGTIAAFHDTLTMDVPRTGGAITAVRVFEEYIYVFRTTSIYRLGGVGLNNEGVGQNYGPATVVSTDVGAVSDESVALFAGGVIFKSRKGWQVLGSNGAITDISKMVSDYDVEDVLAIDVVETQFQVRVLTAARVIMWDYDANQWGTWSVVGGVTACMYRGTHVVATSAGTRMQLATYDGVDYGMDVQVAWLKPANMTADAQNDRAPGGQGRGLVRTVQPLGEVRVGGQYGAGLRVRISYDYIEDVVDDRTWWSGDGAVPRTLQLRHDTARRRCQAMRVRLTAIGPQGQSSAALDMSTLSQPVLTSGAPWAAQWITGVIGDNGNRIALLLYFDAGAPGSDPVVEVREHMAWVPVANRWLAARNVVGVHVTCDPAAPITVGALEAAIVAGLSSDLVILDSGDPAPGKTLDVVTLAGDQRGGGFDGGVYGVPTGEALRLTGLGVEVGLEPGIYRRLPPAQEQ